MFEHFGLKDVFYGLWKYKWKMLLGGIVISAIVTAVFMLAPVKTEPPAIETGGQEEIQRKETYFYFDYNGNDQSLSSDVLARMYVSTIEDQACKDFIVDHVLHLITKENIIQYLNGSVTEEQITTNFFTQYINVTIDSTDVGIKILSRTPSREFTNILSEAYIEWFRSLVDDNPQVSVNIVSENEDTITIKNETTTTLSEESGLSVSKIIIVTFIVAILFECIVVFFIILFKPTLNRKADFEQLGFNVLGTLKISEKE